MKKKFKKLLLLTKEQRDDFRYDIRVALLKHGAKQLIPFFFENMEKIGGQTRNVRYQLTEYALIQST